MDNKRKLNISFAKGGAGSTYTRLSLPITWVRDMGLTQDDKVVIVEYDEHKQTITIKKYDEFADKEF